MNSKSDLTALVIGGSGMLSQLSQELARQYKVVGVVGRTKSKMKSLSKSPNITPIYIDYNNTEALEAAIKQLVTEYGKPTLTVAWVHSDAPEATLAIAKHCSGDFYEVTGNSGYQPDHTSHKHKSAIEKLDLQYHKIILGHVGDRWLTNSEISQGAIQAISEKKAEYIVGEL